MDLLSSLFSILTGNVLSFIIVLSVVVFIHEMGHYLVGRWCGIHAEVFSVGFGSEIWGRTAKDGTRWRIAIIPLGGYVRFKGDQNPSSMGVADVDASETPEEQEGAFHRASVLKRSLTVLAGPMANFILTILIFTTMFTIYGRQIADPVVADIIVDSPAERAGLQVGDRFISVDGITVQVFQDLRRYVVSRPETEIELTIERRGSVRVLTLIPDRIQTKDGFGNQLEEGRMGVVVSADSGNFRTQTFTVTQALAQAFSESWYIVTRTFDYIGNIFIGRESADQLSGPIGIAKVSGQVATIGIIPLIHLMAVISLSIGLLNLMPVPILDGGHLVFYAIEAITGRPVSQSAQDVAFRVGLFLLVSLMVFTTFNDVGAIYRSVTGG